MEKHIFTSNELESLKGEELERWVLSPGDIFLKRKFGKPLLIKKSGDVIDFDFLKKVKGKEVLLRSHLNSDLNFEGYLESILNSEMEDERLAGIDKFIKHFFETYWLKERPACTLDFIYPIFNALNSLSREEIERISLKNEDFFKRSLIVGSLSMLFSLFFRHSQKELLGDMFVSVILYHYFLWDFVLMEDTSSNMNKLREQRKHNWNLESLNLTHDELNRFNESLIQNEFVDGKFTNPDFKNCFKLFFEDGSSFKGNVLTNGDLVTWERCLIFSHKCVPYQKFEFKLDDKLLIPKIIEQAFDNKLGRQLNFDSFIRNLYENFHFMRKEIESAQEVKGVVGF